MSTRDAQAQPQGHSYFVMAGGLRSHAWVCGQGKPLVIVPGLGCASWMYRRVAAALAESRQVFIYDPPGHGWSQGERHLPRRIEQLTDHLADWLRVMRLGDIPVFGHSLGGEVILDLAARYPHLISALIACAPTGVPENPHVSAQFMRLLLDLTRERPPLLPLGFASYAICGARRLYILARDQEKHLTGPLLAHIKVPTLLLAGERDPVIHAWTVKIIQQAVQGAVIRSIPGGTHALTDSHPQTVARLTLDFLDSVGK